MRALLDMLLAMSNAHIAVQPDPKRVRASDIPRIVGDPHRAQADLGWTATIVLEDTLRNVLEACREKL